MRPVLISAADAAYARCLLQLAASLDRVDTARSITCIAYDLGMSEAQRRTFARHHRRWELRRFDFTKLPEHVRIRPRAINTNAWKPLAIAEVLAETSQPVLWLDSACVVLASLGPIFEHVVRTGLYTPFGGASSVAELTHPGTLARLETPAWVGRERQRASGVLGADPTSTVARKLVRTWADACVDEACVVPRGAKHDNHRFDQSVLNALLYPLARREGIALTRDEIDVSSIAPTPIYRTRNKVWPWLPRAADPLARVYFAAYRFADVQALRLKRALATRSRAVHEA